MKNLLTVLLLCAFSAQAQHVLSNRLQEKLNNLEHIDELVSIRIALNDKLDAFELHKSFITNRTPVDERAIITVKSLQERAQQTQRELLSFLENQGADKVSKIRNYWIINQVYVEIQRDLIYSIGAREDVAYVDLNSDHLSAMDPIIYSDEEAKVTSGVEPGLIAINAPALWGMGYTGAGLLVYDYDTGVWPDHPTFSNRFMGNHFPMSESWYGYFNNFPNGTVSNHGTHTLGTMIGEGLPSGDTIGVAPGAYWMACDLVTSTVAALPPLENLVAAYEWALDADNNPETTFNIPNVINNSWRWNDNTDTTHCTDYIADLMNALEAAGIASVFSGGNHGPSNTTISAPQRINTTIVNTFSVGSINANIDSLPLSSFSSHGPTQCPGEGSLAIHPEVVAPGHNVRSAWGNNSFNSISGTSMAAPHVSGACLLLKEAFPEASGADILTALYFTASDMGEEGEDNLYGMGLINCLAAFNYLAESFTPANPNELTNDLELTTIIEPTQDIHCSDIVNPLFAIKNNGIDVINTVMIEWTLNGVNGESQVWNGTLAPNESVELSLPSFTIEEDSLYELYVRAIVPGWNEKNAYNNSRSQRFKKLNTILSPFVEDFEADEFDDTKWTIHNPDFAQTWELKANASLPNSLQSARMRLFSYSTIGEKDYLQSPNIDLGPTNEEKFLHFTYAYQYRSGANEDSLMVEISSDCGMTYNTLFSEDGANLSTTDTLDTNFQPEYPSHWEKITFNISAYENVIVRFVSVNGKRNNIYLDNISIGVQEDFAISEQTKSLFKLFPNPARDIVNIRWKGASKQSFSIHLIDLSGRTIEQRSFEDINHLNLQWSLDHLNSGYYFFRFNSESENQTYPIIKQ